MRIRWDEFSSGERRTSSAGRWIKVGNLNQSCDMSLGNATGLDAFSLTLTPPAFLVCIAFIALLRGKKKTCRLSSQLKVSFNDERPNSTAQHPKKPG